MFRRPSNVLQSVIDGVIAELNRCDTLEAIDAIGFDKVIAICQDSEGDALWAAARIERAANIH